MRWRHRGPSLILRALSTSPHTSLNAASEVYHRELDDGSMAAGGSNEGTSSPTTRPHCPSCREQAASYKQVASMPYLRGRK